VNTYLYAGTVNGGVWRTTNALTAPPTWTPLTDNQRSLSIGALTMDPANANRLLAGFGTYSSFGFLGGPEGGLLLTADGGATWQALDPAALAGLRISSAQIRGNTFLVGTEPGAAAAGPAGVYRSTDGGTTFARTLDGAASEVVGDPSNANRFYAAVLNVGVFISNDGGVTWTNVSQNDATANGLQATINTGNNTRSRVAVASDGRVFAAILLFGNLRWFGFSDDQGATWTAMDVPVTNVPGRNGNIVNASNTSPIVITTAAAHNLPVTNAATWVQVAGVQGNTAANGNFQIAAITTATPNNQFTLLGSAGKWQPRHEHGHLAAVRDAAPTSQARSARIRPFLDRRRSRRQHHRLRGWRPPGAAERDRGGHVQRTSVSGPDHRGGEPAGDPLGAMDAPHTFERHHGRAGRRRHGERQRAARGLALDGLRRERRSHRGQ
jgi:hypothetical protein